MIIENMGSYTDIFAKSISLFTYLAVFLGGILASFTPCVYPLIPITISYIGARSVNRKTEAFIISLLYVLGMAFSYSCLGAAAVLGGRIFGEISRSPITYLFVGNIFLFLGLSMLDVFTLPIPGFLKRQIPTAGKKGLFGSFLTGACAGLAIGPCTGPMLGALLMYVGSRQNFFLGVTLLFTFALGMGLILLIVGTFAGAAVSLPKSGRWMNVIKKAFGIILILCAEYFIILAGGRLI
jgi:thiol:disulfide interchange protein DsbD